MTGPGMVRGRKRHAVLPVPDPHPFSRVPFMLPIPGRQPDHHQLWGHHLVRLCQAGFPASGWSGPGRWHTSKHLVFALGGGRAAPLPLWVPGPLSRALSGLGSYGRKARGSALQIFPNPPPVASPVPYGTLRQASRPWGLLDTVGM